MSTLFVNNISHTNDTSAMTINSTGTITPSKMVLVVMFTRSEITL